MERVEIWVVLMADFNGIDTFHDGMAVSDYVNMIPLGSTCVDRVGDRLVFDVLTDVQQKVRGVFVDSHHNIYVAYGALMFRYTYDEGSDKITGSATPMMMYMDGEYKTFEFYNKEHPVTFCESSLKPSEVFACDGQFIYAWATYDGLTRPQYSKFSVNVLCPPNIGRVSSNDNGLIVNWQSDLKQPDFNSIIFGEGRNTPSGKALFKLFDDMIVDKVEWFDNRLVTTQLSKNTVWLTRTDPTYFWRDVNKDVAYLDSEDPSTGGYELWPNWYSSSASSDKLLSVSAYNGQLYFFNEHTIEIWGRTGNEDAPIQSATQQVLHFGGKMPTVIDGVLYFIGIDSMCNNFVGAFSPGFVRVSNAEIERRLGVVTSLHKLSMYNKTFLFVKNDGEDGFVFGEGRWWRWKTPVNSEYSIITSVIKDYAITDKSSIVRFDNELRVSGGQRIPRSIRDGFVQFSGRGIIQSIELIADTGRIDFESTLTLPTDKSIYCAVSTNRGMSFSQRRYRTLGDSGHNNKVIQWLGFGSGNSVLIEIGSSSLHKLQIYDIKPIIK